MFNFKWYKQQYNIPDNIDPALHYLHAGWRKGYNPSELFDTDLYLSFYNEIKTNPLIDYENRAHDKRYAPSCIRKPFDILFISSIPKIDGVYLWRVKFLKELFEYNGYTTAEESLTELSPEFLDKLYNAKCVVFSRPVNSGMSAKIIKELKKYKKKFIIDIDDLLINSFAAYGGRYKSGGIDYRSVSRNILSQSECFEYCNSMFVSTPFIKNAVKKDFNISVSVLPNVISPKYLKMKHYNRTKGFKLLYASGSITHDNDASTIYLDLLNILYKYKDVSLTVLGWSSFQNNFKMFQDRICTIPFTSFENMLSIYAGSDLLLVPLDYNPFNNAKSNIKYIEAGAVGTPVIARDTDEFRAVIKDGFNGFLYNDNFYEKFEEIYQNKDCLVTVGENAYSDVLNNHCTNRKLAREIKELLC